MNVDYDIQNGSTITGNNQEVTFVLNSYTVKAIASINLPVINFYGGFGYNGGTSKLKMKGSYNLVYNTSLPAPQDKITTTVNDPLNLNFNSILNNLNLIVNHE